MAFKEGYQMTQPDVGRAGHPTLLFSNILLRRVTNHAKYFHFIIVFSILKSYFYFTESV